MDNSLGVEQRSNIKRPNSFLISSVMFFDRIEKWLAGFFEMTREEQKDAGIYFDDQSDK